MANKNYKKAPRIFGDFSQEIEGKGEGANLTVITVEPTTTTETYTPEEPFNGYSSVTVEAVDPSEYYKPEVACEITPTTSAQTITPETGKVFNQVNVSAVTSAIDNNIQASNIKKDVSILGVTGSYEAPTIEEGNIYWYNSTEEEIESCEAEDNHIYLCYANYNMIDFGEQPDYQDLVIYYGDSGPGGLSKITVYDDEGHETKLLSEGIIYSFTNDNNGGGSLEALSIVDEEGQDTQLTNEHWYYYNQSNGFTDYGRFNYEELYNFDGTYFRKYEMQSGNIYYWGGSPIALENLGSFDESDGIYYYDSYGFEFLGNILNGLYEYNNDNTPTLEPVTLPTETGDTTTITINGYRYTITCDGPVE